MANDQPRYKAFRLPSTTLEPALLRKFAAISADAIRASRAERMIIFANELLRRPEEWAQRLRQDDLAHWILVASNAETGTLSVAEGQWVGIYIIQGPLSEGEMDLYFDVMDDNEDSPPSNETRWIGRSFYLREAHRNLDAMKALIMAEAGSVADFRAQHQELGPVTARIASTALANKGSHGLQSASEDTQAVKILQFKDIMEADGVTDQAPKLCNQAAYIWDSPRMLFHRVIRA